LMLCVAQSSSIHPWYARRILGRRKVHTIIASIEKYTRVDYEQVYR
jgi:hypothetical protein